MNNLLQEPSSSEDGFTEYVNKKKTLKKNKKLELELARQAAEELELACKEAEELALARQAEELALARKEAEELALARKAAEELELARQAEELELARKAAEELALARQAEELALARKEAEELALARKAAEELALARKAAEELELARQAEELELARKAAEELARKAAEELAHTAAEELELAHTADEELARIADAQFTFKEVEQLVCKAEELVLQAKKLLNKVNFNHKATKQLVLKEVEQISLKEAEQLVCKATEELICKATKQLAHKKAEELAHKEVEQIYRKEAEELARKEAEELARKEAEELARKEAEELAHKKAELARKEAKQLDLTEAEQLDIKEADKEIDMNNNSELDEETKLIQKKRDEYKEKVKSLIEEIKPYIETAIETSSTQEFKLKNTDNEFIPALAAVAKDFIPKLKELVNEYNVEKNLSVLFIVAEEGTTDLEGAHKNKNRIDTNKNNVLYIIVSPKKSILKIKHEYEFPSKLEITEALKNASPHNITEAASALFTVRATKEEIRQKCRENNLAYVISPKMQPKDKELCRFRVFGCDKPEYISKSSRLNKLKK